MVTGCDVALECKSMWQWKSGYNFIVRFKKQMLSRESRPTGMYSRHNKIDGQLARVLPSKYTPPLPKNKQKPIYLSSRRKTSTKVEYHSLSPRSGI